MNVYVLNSKIKKRDYDGVILDENDFHPCRPFFIDHPNIKPESVEKIHIKGILEQHPYVRCIFRYCDYMLAKNGVLEVEFYNKNFDCPGIISRGFNEWACELSIVFQERIHLLEKNNELNGLFVYKKLESFLPEGDSIDKWSFGVVSDGRKNERVKAIVQVIESFQIPNYEVLICGPSPYENERENVRILDDLSFYNDIRIPISKKKNYIIEQSKYNNLIVIHDRMMFSKTWYSDMQTYGNYFDCLSFPIKNEDNHFCRMADWGTYTDSVYKLKLWDRFRLRPRLLEYDEWSPHIYIAGGFFLVKKHLIEKVKLAPYLNWGEKEDTDFSIRSYNNGVLFEFFQDTEIYSLATRFSGNNRKSLKNKIREIFMPILKIRVFMHERRMYKKYLNQ